jgi:hypothetical protein
MVHTSRTVTDKMRKVICLKQMNNKKKMFIQNACCLILNYHVSFSVKRKPKKNRNSRNKTLTWIHMIRGKTPKHERNLRSVI